MAEMTDAASALALAEQSLDDALIRLDDARASAANVAAQTGWQSPAAAEFRSLFAQWCAELDSRRAQAALLVAEASGASLPTSIPGLLG